MDQSYKKSLLIKNQTFKIEKILSRQKRRGKDMAFVKWIGWPDEFNSWILEKQIIQLSLRGTNKLHTWMARGFT